MPQEHERDAEESETREWRESLEHVLKHGGSRRVTALLRELQTHAMKLGVEIPFTANTPYVNTIPASREPPYPGNREIERRIKSLVRWNAMAMVVKANRRSEGIGGHISTFASAATLYEVGFNHFFRGRSDPSGGDLVFFQGHASPGIYARAYLEGRLSDKELENFRREMAAGGGLSSYPHPWLMPDFWEVPTVSMGLGPIMAIYQARFVRYLEDRGLKPRSDSKVWAFLGDGETDEPESLGAIGLAAREKLDNLIFVINCNLQRLDGPVRGNGQIIQELEADFRGAGWNVIKVLWGSDWDPLFEKDTEGLLARRLAELVDGEYQRLATEGGDIVRKRVFGGDPRLEAMVAGYSDEQLSKMRRGGHDPVKVHAAYQAAVNHRGQPTVVLAMTVKGYGLGAAGEARNVTHSQKKLNEEEMQQFRSRFGIPLSDREVADTPFYRPTEGSEEIRYLLGRRRALGGFLPNRRREGEPVPPFSATLFDEFCEGSEERQLSTTMVFVRMLSKLLRDPGLGPRVVPIVSDEARTFGMESLFRQCGIYSHPGQLYEPVDSKSLLYYKEATDGQILEEGITEAGALSSFIAAGSSRALHGVTMVPFFIFYSMFGLQRVGDLVWAAADTRSRGFLFGATSGRTTLAGEGLQHQDGQSHLMALAIPTLQAYDPAYAYELAVIVRDGMRRMPEKGEAVFYYITLTNENYAQPPMPPGVEEGILRGIYRLREAPDAHSGRPRVRLLGSGALLNEVVAAQGLLDALGVAAEVFSVTSYKALREEAVHAERWNRLHPEAAVRVPYITSVLGRGDSSPVVAVTDYVRALPDCVSRWVPGAMLSLGTDGFGRSEARAELRDFFEVDRRHITAAALHLVASRGEINAEVVARAIADLGIAAERPDPARA
ncbi:MAG: pyruvate dehydrogenase (acetyl-transferring), homodimeric type [Magnetococcales bacterium]|nr:pyruvate dehydrogenase (acetyl-transferring), homodimeric type [Magnetococcales bacterium]MBF0157678.1 pyruvate dehydrogenase (acetyl-transferring), homodimeric type [Magnetococcales bacterium]